MCAHKHLYLSYSITTQIINSYLDLFIFARMSIQIEISND